MTFHEDKKLAVLVRVGLIVPSSNVTIETELPALLARHEAANVGVVLFAPDHQFIRAKISKSIGTPWDALVVGAIWRLERES